MDALLDEYLKEDPETRAAIEVMAMDGRILAAGEVSSKASVDAERILKRLCAKVSYMNFPVPCTDSVLHGFLRRLLCGTCAHTDPTSSCRYPEMSLHSWKDRRQCGLHQKATECRSCANPHQP
ncbi:MAG TPA: hypothetical protein IAA52_09750 [Candidatus Pullichristensenella stercorigallinarum]|uniref:S-adenosylmethionine synthetase N-terminal domain-containing protein n=1 Tax=Candidatus Pullichristensenella stercorigallinarum TaxID=2840909 RepID=A0A9D0ZMX0_9FIRM|nr:hypothetical protein [Candidatus Pullichristensenella stercorigallinarum]